jgi:protein SCO1/2
MALTAAPWARSLAANEHAHHGVPKPPSRDLTRTVIDARLPAVQLVRADGHRVGFPSDIDDGRPVFLNFVYTTCTAICPVMTQIFSAFEKQLGADAAKVRLVSVSIDPEQDTPRRLTAYAKQFEAGSGWTFYTGTLEASVAVQKAFGVYRGDKMNHTPLTLIRAAPGRPWVRVDGFVTPDGLLQEYRALATSAR